MKKALMIAITAAVLGPGVCYAEIRFTERWLPLASQAMVEPEPIKAQTTVKPAIMVAEDISASQSKVQSQPKSASCASCSGGNGAGQSKSGCKQCKTPLLGGDQVEPVKQQGLTGGSNGGMMLSNTPVGSVQNSSDKKKSCPNHPK